MALFVSSLNSGSNGNCYYIGNENEAILVDGGISRRETEKRLKRLGLSLQKIRAIFISHEHGDHIHGVAGILKKYDIPVYFTPRTLAVVKNNLSFKEGIARTFQAYETIEIGKLSIKGFPKLHDACDPHSFVVSSEGITVGVFTDIGSPCDHVRKHFLQCHAAFLESNYDEEMLEKGRYSYPLKNRIRGGYGHLSNRQALKLFLDNRPHFMSHLFLSHLSRDNNSPDLVQALFNKVAGKTRVVIAGRYQETGVFCIANDNRNYTMKPIYSKAVLKKAQLSLF
jgi:phosphoribosyl 1,2-cyclic phosphodiesterase